MMIAVKIRDLVHNFSHFIKEVKQGEVITIYERTTPVADIIPHNDDIHYPGWKRKIKKITPKGESFSETVVKYRKEDR